MAPTRSRKRKKHRTASLLRRKTTKSDQESLTVANDDTPLLRLPPELREQIFAHVVGYQTHFVRSTSNGKLKVFGVQQKPDLPLLLTCRRIYSEARDLMWKNHVFENIHLAEYSHTSLTKFVDCLTIRQREALRSIRLSGWDITDLGLSLDIHNEALLTQFDIRAQNRYFSLAGLRSVHFTLDTWPGVSADELGDRLSVCNQWMRWLRTFRRPDVPNVKVTIKSGWRGDFETFRLQWFDVRSRCEALSDEQRLRWEGALKVLLAGRNSGIITDRAFLLPGLV